MSFLSIFEERYISDVLWPRWIKGMAASICPVEWKKAFVVAARKSGVDEFVAEDVSVKPALQRLLINTFRPDRNIPSASDFAVSLAFELYGYDGFSERCISASSIRYLAVSARKNWLGQIIESSILRYRFKQVRDEHPAKYISVESSCMEQCERVLKDRIELFTCYFSSFSAEDATEEVLVWLPGEDGGVYPYSPGCPSISVLLNPSQGADRGFFRVGFDYTLGRTGTQLSACFLDRDNFMESADFGRNYLGGKNSEVIWIR